MYLLIFKFQVHDGIENMIKALWNQYRHEYMSTINTASEIFHSTEFYGQLFRPGRTSVQTDILPNSIKEGLPMYCCIKSNISTHVNQAYKLPIKESSKITV